MPIAGPGAFVIVKENERVAALNSHDACVRYPPKTYTLFRGSTQVMSCTIPTSTTNSMLNNQKRASSKTMFLGASEISLPPSR